MIATAMNLAIALVEEHPEKVRGMLRNLPLQQFEETSAPIARLRRAVDVRIKMAIHEELRDLLKFSMTIPWPGEHARAQAFLEGVTIMEDAIQTKLDAIRIDLGLNKESE